MMCDKYDTTFIFVPVKIEIEKINKQLNIVNCGFILANNQPLGHKMNKLLGRIVMWRAVEDL
jgi:hypothetical protein